MVALVTFVTVVTLVTKLAIFLVVAVGTRTRPKFSALQSFSNFFQSFAHILDINVYTKCIFCEIFRLNYELTHPRKILLQKSTLRHLMNKTSALYEILLEFFFYRLSLMSVVRRMNLVHNHPFSQYSC